jgi:hypothetical protein
MEFSKNSNSYETLDIAKSHTKEFYVEDSDDYYLVMENDQNPSRKIRGIFHIGINATSFDTTKASGFYEGSFR